MLGVLGAVGLGGYALRGQVQTIIEQLPEAAKTFSTALARLHTDPAGNMQRMQSAAAEVEKAATQAAGGPAPPRPAATHVVVDAPGFKLGNFLLSGSVGAVGFLGQTIMVLFLTFFLLLGGDTFKRKLVRLTGPSLSSKKITVQILDDINDSIQKYLFMLLLTNVLVAVLAWIVFRWIGLENAGAWAVASGLLHVIPYLGPGVTAAATGDGGVHAVRILPDGVSRRRSVADDRHHRGHLRHDLDDGPDREDECGGRLHLAAVLGLALGHLGNAAGHPDRRHRQGRVRTRGATATRGRVAGRVEWPGDPSSLPCRGPELKVGRRTLFERLLAITARFGRGDEFARYADEEPPLRSELFSADQMEQHGRNLALAHKLAPGRAPDQLLTRLAENDGILAEVCDLLDGRGHDEPPHHARRGMAAR